MLLMQELRHTKNHRGKWTREHIYPRLVIDGQDLAFINVDVLDKDGNIVSDADIPLTVSVKGRATLLAAASANLKDLEPKTSPKVTTYKGKAIIVVRSGRKAGKAIISARLMTVRTTV